jgi:hypothetical protein
VLSADGGRLREVIAEHAGLRRVSQVESHLREVLLAGEAEPALERNKKLERNEKRSFWKRIIFD